MPRIQHKRGTSANLASVNPTPLAGELVWDSSENAIKIGDGSTAWTSLAYVTATPRSHVHDGADITTGTVAYARLPVGSTSSTVCAGDDSRLTDARTPTAHKASHATGGSDALTPGDIGAAPAASPVFSGNVGIGVNPAGSFNSSFDDLVVGTGTGNRGIIINTDSSSQATVAFADGTSGAAAYAGAIQYSHSTDTLAFWTASASRVTIGSTGVITVAAGTAAAPAIVASGDSNTGVFFPAGGDRFAISTDGLERLRINNLGNVGIGTNSPASRLDVNGVITVSATSGSAGSYLPSLTISGDANTGFGQVSGQSDSASVFTAGHERVRVRSDGGAVFGGGAGFANHRFAIIASLTSPGGNIVNFSSCTAQTGVTLVYGNWTQVSVASGVTLSVLHHNYVTQGTFSGAVTTQSGFFVASTLTGATNNYGFRSAIASGTGRWNLYMDGSAQNYLAGNVGIGVSTPSAALDINADTIRLRTAKTPASASDTGNAGDICWDASYLYICTATNTWRRIAHSTW